MSKYYLNYLDELESEAIFVLREVWAQFENPVILFSGGKDSILVTHLAKKAFYPAKIPFPLMHVDTGHNFPETIQAGQTINVAFHCKRLGRFSGMKFSIRNKGGAVFRQDTVMDCSEGYWTENRFSIPVNVTTDLEVWTFGPSSSSSYSTIIDNIIVTVN